MSYTPGPWEFSHTWVQTVADKTPIANFNFYAAKDANASLIAAAPELLEALQDLVDTGFVGGPQLKRAQAAIAKATWSAQ